VVLCDEVVELVLVDGVEQPTIVAVHKISATNKTNNFFKVFAPLNNILGRTVSIVIWSVLSTNNE
jgi:hypothetical protein